MILSQNRRLLIYQLCNYVLPFERLYAFRRWMLRLTGVRCGKNCQISRSVIFKGNGIIEIGNEVKMGGWGRVFVSGNLRIHDKVELMSGFRIDVTARTGSVEIGARVSVRYDSRIMSHGRIALGSDKVISEEVFLQTYGNAEILIGDGGCIAPRTYISAAEESKIQIGNQCKLAHMISIKTNEHMITPDGEGCIGGDRRCKDIKIEDGCWICAGSIIIPGVSIGKKSIVAAGAVVTRDVPSYSLVAGCPAVCKKKYLK